MTREITIVTPEHVELTFELAGIGSRFVAILLDTLLQAAAPLALFLIFALTVRSLAFIRLAELSPWIMAVFALLLFSLWEGYFLFFEATRNGQTPGKKAARIRVIRDTGHPIDFRAALLRNVMRVVDSLPSAYGVGFVTMFLSPQYRRLGDYVAGTLVVRTGRQHEVAGVSAAALREPSPSSAPSDSEASELASALPDKALPYLSMITRDDYRAVRHFLDRRSGFEEAVAQSLAQKLAGLLAAKLQLAPTEIDDPVAFLETLGREWERRMIH